MHDPLIRGAALIDGTGAPARIADLAVTDGRIAAIGSFNCDAGFDLHFLQHGCATRPAAAA